MKRPRLSPGFELDIFKKQQNRLLGDLNMKIFIHTQSTTPCNSKTKNDFHPVSEGKSSQFCTSLLFASAIILSCASSAHAGEAKRSGNVVEYNDGLFVDNNANTPNEVTAGFNSAGHFIVQDVNDVVKPGPGCARLSNSTVDCGTGTVSKIKMNLAGGNDIVSPLVASSEIPMEIDGGDGNDTITGSYTQDTLKGGNGNDHINGSRGGDNLYGEGGKDTIIGSTGNDFISGGFDDDNLDGGKHNDTIHGDLGNDTITGGLDSDKMYGDFGADRFVANDGVIGETVDCGIDLDLDRVGTTVLEDSYQNCSIQEITTQ